VYSRSKKSADSLITDGSVDVYSDDSEKGLEELLRREDIQAVDIALPIMAQPHVIRKALQAGKHVVWSRPPEPISRLDLRETNCTDNSRNKQPARILPHFVLPRNLVRRRTIPVQPRIRPHRLPAPLPGSHNLLPLRNVLERPPHR
jgi:Oxidoreductase family, NAD-binding Rossmann fold